MPPGFLKWLLMFRPIKKAETMQKKAKTLCLLRSRPEPFVTSRQESHSPRSSNTDLVFEVSLHAPSGVAHRFGEGWGTFRRGCTRLLGLRKRVAP
jgi:hypothetical protein